MNNLKNKKFVAALAVLAVIIIALVIVGLVYSNRGGQSGNTNNAAGPWATYTSRQYSFQFDYLKSWGQPKLTTAPAVAKPNIPNAPQITKLSGQRYTITFPAVQIKTPILLTLDSDDYKTKACLSPSQCSTSEAYSKASVRRTLAGNAANPAHKLLKSDGDSYATLLYTKTQANLNLSKIVELSKINVSAASLSYSLLNPAADCPADKLAQAGSQKCITETDYANLDRLISSLRSI